MPTASLTIGPTHATVSGQVYALPGRVVNIHFKTNVGILPQFSNDGVTFTDAIPDDNKNVVGIAAFLKITGTSSVVLRGL